MERGVPWEVAWHRALYGPSGFYRDTAGPAGHFATASHAPLGAVLAHAVLRLADRHGLTTIVDLGAGRGELLAALAVQDTGARTLLGVDVVPRPGGLDERVGWLTAPGGAALPTDLVDLEQTLVVANEWLDVVPCPVAQADADGTLRTVLVEPSTGEEHLGDPLGTADAAWARRWWPPGRHRHRDHPAHPDHPAHRTPGADRFAPGERVEIGRTRDAVWSALLDRLRTGVAVAVDYGHTRDERPHRGTLAAYRLGELLDPARALACATSGGSPVDITAHVAVDSLCHDRLLSQREALTELGLSAERPDPELARTDPARYLERLAEASAVGELCRPGGLGDFTWVLARRDGPVSVGG